MIEQGASSAFEKFRAPIDTFVDNISSRHKRFDESLFDGTFQTLQKTGDRLAVSQVFIDREISPWMESLIYQKREGAYQGISSAITELSLIDVASKLEGKDLIETGKSSIRDGIVFLSNLHRKTKKPIISLADDGELVLEWKSADKSDEAVVSFEGDGFFGYALLQGNEFKPGESDGDLKVEIPADLDEYLSSLSV